MRRVVAKLERVIVEPGATVVREGEPLSALVLVGDGSFVATVGVEPADYLPSMPARAVPPSAGDELGEPTEYGRHILPDRDHGWGPIYYAVLRRVS